MTRNLFGGRNRGVVVRHATYFSIVGVREGDVGGVASLTRGEDRGFDGRLYANAWSSVSG